MTADRLLSVEEALDLVMAAITGPVGRETVGLGAAAGRIVAETAVSRTALPPWDNSAMDGYAIRAGDVASASEAAPVRLEVRGEVRAGADPAGIDVLAGTAVRIATGAPVPSGADAVVPVEATTPIDAAGNAGGRGRDATGPLPAACLVHEPVPAGGSIRRAASDLGADVDLVGPGTVVTPAVVSLLAGAGLDRLTVHRRPRVAILATGDEVRPPGEALGPAGIPDANGPGLAALVEATGADAVRLGIALDRLEDVRGRLRAGLDAGVDAIILSGGVSVGPYDVVRSAIEEIGSIGLWRVRVQPGKPFAFGTALRPGSATPILLFGLPGNPVSTFVTFELFVRPALRRLAGRRDGDLHRPVDRAVLRDAVSKSPGRRGYQRVIAERDPAGTPVRDGQGRVPVRLAGGQGSHVISALAAADALAVIPEAHDQLPAGSEVQLWWLDRA
jgi:molybdopterin molybdotransferase